MFCELALVEWTLVKCLKHMRCVMCRRGTPYVKNSHRMSENLTSHHCCGWRGPDPRTSLANYAPVKGSHVYVLYLGNGAR